MTAALSAAIGAGYGTLGTLSVDEPGAPHRAAYEAWQNVARLAVTIDAPGQLLAFAAPLPGHSLVGDLVEQLDRLEAILAVIQAGLTPPDPRS
jgi:hypothetical protein